MLRALLQALLLLSLSAAGALLTQRYHPRAPALTLAAEKAPPGFITVEDARALLAAGPPGVLWLDARIRTQHEKANIPGSILCNEQEWTTAMEAVVPAIEAIPHRPIIIYCDAQKCAASKTIRDQLAPLIPDARPLHILHGGWPAWLAAP